MEARPGPATVCLIAGGGRVMAEQQAGFLERRFELSAHGTSVRTEFIAGLTTFLTMV